MTLAVADLTKRCRAGRVLRRGLCVALLAAATVVTAQPASTRLRIVGGLAGLNQLTRHEEPFWTTRLPALTGGRFSADVMPFDRAGIRSQEMLALVQLGTVPFGTMLLSGGSAKHVDLSAPDLAGLNPDIAALRRTVAAFRPYMQSTLLERYGVELLAIYTYPAQVVFCNQPLAGLEGLKGRRVRTSSATQAEWAEALGATPVVTPFAEIAAGFKAGNIDCAITGTMSGNTIGIDRLTTHLHSAAVTWGLSIFVANGAAWKALPAELRDTLRRELPALERDIWDEAARETRDGIACNTGDPKCQGGRRGSMTEVVPTAADEQRRRELLARTVLPRWLKRCGPTCADVWNRTLAPVTGVEARPQP